MHLAAIHLYPVKALRGLDRTSAVVEPWGLLGDRRFLVVDHHGRFLTQRECPRLAQIDATPDEEGLRLHYPACAPVQVLLPAPDADRLSVSIWRDSVTALCVGAAVDRWLTTVLEQPCRLVYMADPANDRPADPAFAAAEDRVSFADGYPLLVTSQASLDDLNARLETRIGMDRFRPNLVITGTPAWAEDDWKRIRVGPVTFDVVKPCARCIVTTTDQRTGARDPKVEPIRTMQRFRRDASGQVVFGQNLVPRGVGTVTVGDAVSLLPR